MKNFLNDFFKLGVSRILIIFSSIFTSILTARYLGPEKNGIVAALLVYPTLFMSIGSLGIRQSSTYFKGREIFTDNQIKRAIVQIWIFTSFFSIIACFCLLYFTTNLKENLTFILLTIIAIPFTLFNTYVSGIFLGKNQIKEFNRINWVPPCIILVSTILMVVIFKFHIYGYLIALLSGPIFIFIFLLIKNNFFNLFSFKVDLKVIKPMLSLGIVYALALVLISLNYRIDIIILEKLSSPYEMGIYAKGVNLVEMLWQVPMVLNTIVFARSATSKNNHQFSLKVSQLLRISIIIILIGSILLFFLSDFLVTFLLGIDFIESANVLRVLLPGVFFLILFKVFNMDLAGKGKPWISIKAMLPALIINIILNITLIPNYGAYGAAISSSISYTVAGILFLYFYSKEVNISISQILVYNKTDFLPIIMLIKKIRRNN